MLIFLIVFALCSRQNYDGWMDRQTDGWMDGLIDGWTKRQLNALSLWNIKKTLNTKWIRLIDMGLKFQ